MYTGVTEWAIQMSSDHTILATLGQTLTQHGNVGELGEGPLCAPKLRVGNRKLKEEHLCLSAQWSSEVAVGPTALETIRTDLDK